MVGNDYDGLKVLVKLFASKRVWGMEDGLRLGLVLISECADNVKRIAIV